MSQTDHSVDDDQTGSWDVADGWVLADGEEAVNGEYPDNGTVLCHETGAEIAIGDMQGDTWVDVSLPDGDIHTLAEVSDPKHTVRAIAQKYSIAAEIEASSSIEDAMFRYYAVLNPHGHGPVPLCRRGSHPTVYDTPTKAAVVSEEIRHEYGNEEVRVTQLDRTSLEGL